MRRSAPILTLLAALCLWAAPLAAHPLTTDGGTIAGLAHPFSGLDHVLAMIAVGLLAVRASGGLRWVLPATFVVALFGGGAAAAAGLAPGVAVAEWGTAISVVALGAGVALVVRVRPAHALAVAGFALFHGWAHGHGMGAAVAGPYLAGMAAGTALLHGAGIALGLALVHSLRPWAVRAAGAALALGFLAF